MLHLAQVQKQELSANLSLRLLACQETEYTWVVMTKEVIVPTTEMSSDARIELVLSEGMLVLAELSSTDEIESIQDATYWVLEMVQTYLSNGITPAFLQQEVERAEKWRQTLSLQSQDLARRSLELEARREQIQALEESIRREEEGEGSPK